MKGMESTITRRKRRGSSMMGVRWCVRGREKKDVYDMWIINDSPCLPTCQASSEWNMLGFVWIQMTLKSKI
jgi:hypothetical protein